MLRKFLKNDTGAAAIEFALLIPVIFGMLLGVLQIGVGMQAYNAMRSVTADTSRFAVVEYQKENKINVAAIETYAENLASRPPYGLTWGTFNATVTQPDTQRVDGATEFEIETTYTVPSVLGFIGVNAIPISFTRPIFVLT